MDGFGFVGEVAGEGGLGQGFDVGEGFAQIGGEPVFVLPFLTFAFELVVEDDVEPGTEDGLGAQDVVESGDGEFGGVEETGIGPEGDLGAGVALSDLADGVEFGDLFTMGKGHGVLDALPFYADFEMFGEGVDDGNTDAMEPAGEAIVFGGEFAAGVEASQDDLNAGYVFLGMDVDGHAAPVVDDGEGAVFVQDYGDAGGVSCDGFVYAVVDYLLGQMIGPGGVGVHAGALAHRVKPGEDFDVGGVVVRHGLAIGRGGPD